MHDAELKPEEKLHFGSRKQQTACLLIDFWADLDWLVLVCCERKILLVGWFGLAETNKQTCWWTTRLPFPRVAGQQPAGRAGAICDNTSDLGLV